MTQILVVDDVPAMAEQYAYDLKRVGGYGTIVASGGDEALDILGRDPIDCVVLDLEMPGIDGYEVARRLRADVDLADTRLVAVTGRSDEQASALAWDAGFHDFLGKPAPVSMLLAMIRPTREIRAIDRDA